MPIRVLDPKTVARIDAGASRIIVEARGGGVGFIRVIDNGRGIPSKETELAFQRHATSKLGRIEDLERLESLGFRGEALPSIAAVAEVELATSVSGAASGDFLQLKNGDIVQHTSQARSQGTTVTVKNLFRNVPARLKFLKSTATENSHIAGIVTQYALAYPEVQFTLLIEGRTALQSPGAGKLLDAVIAVYGIDLAQKMVDLPAEEYHGGKTSDIKVAGMVSSPVVSRAGRDAISFFMNRRAISNRLLTYAVEEAYQGLLMQGRHPIAVINISLAPASVDVNVHPTKAEVKFQDERAVFAAVQRSVRSALVKLTSIPSIQETGREYRGTRPVATTPLWNEPGKDREATTLNGSPSTSPTVQSSVEAPRLPPLRVIGQVAASYIVTEGPEGMYIIDQHAAHERVLYEKVRSERAGSCVEVQGLLEPATLELTPAEDAVMEESAGELQEYGFAIDLFGERSYLVRAVPAVLSRTDYLSAVREFLADPSKRDKERSEAIAKTLACHGAVLAGKPLTDEEMKSIIRQLEQTASPFTCPHGRPTLIHIGNRQLEREFGRG
jgi:DNA mismatch repair protein MutL